MAVSPSSVLYFDIIRLLYVQQSTFLLTYYTYGRRHIHTHIIINDLHAYNNSIANIRDCLQDIHIQPSLCGPTTTMNVEGKLSARTVLRYCAVCEAHVRGGAY